MPALVLPLLFAACSEDRDSNPTLNLSHASDQFKLNMPGNAVNNTYDLINAENIILTCNQPNYGGVPYVTRYFTQVAFNENDFASGTFKELMSSSTDASSIAVSASELNDAIVDLFKEANPDAAFQSVPRCVPSWMLRARVRRSQTLSPSQACWPHTLLLLQRSQHKSLLLARPYRTHGQVGNL